MTGMQWGLDVHSLRVEGWQWLAELMNGWHATFWQRRMWRPCAIGAGGSLLNGPRGDHVIKPLSPIRLWRRKKTRNHSFSVGLHIDLLPQSKCPRWPSLTQNKVIGLGCFSPDNHQLTGFVLHGSSLVFGRVRCLETIPQASDSYPCSAGMQTDWIWCVLIAISTW